MPAAADPVIRRVIKAALCMQRWPWEQGVLAQAMIEIGEHDLAVLMAKEAAANRSKDGRLAMKYERAVATDPASNGEPLLVAARLTGDAALHDAALAMRDYLLYRAPRTRGGILFHNENQGQIWVDSFFMAPPFLAAIGEHAEAVKQIAGFRAALWDDRAGLFHHQWDDDTRSFARAAFWGVGNGWAAAGMTRVAAALPDSMAEDRATIVGFVRTVVDGCLAHQRSDALFHDVVDDPGTFVETNLAQMLAYTIYRCVARGWLDDAYRDRAEAMRDAARAKVDAYGLVQGVCGAPGFDRAGTAPEGQAFFLLMEAARADAQ